MSDINETVWQSLISCIQETSGPKDEICVLLVSKPVPNEYSRQKDFYACADCTVKKCDPCPIDDLVLCIRTGREGKVNQSYLGFAERVADPDSAKVSYTPDAFRQIRHEAGVRLLKLSETGRDVYFTSHLLGYDSVKVSSELLDKMLGFGKSRKPGLVRVDILKKLSAAEE